ncbi:MAG: UDP-N-acetylmuramoyl-L-alanyl-D-glutamate--2,6-diaminopimelate ligase [Cytophagales bacterium]|nr:UDP-N-acetylmuramoyl-L-alanyl-D-glutamate--2,6-diaminopimelate ligase [Cytophagales bacterium]
MKTLKDILYKVSLVAVSGPMERAVAAVCFDSRQAGPGSLFVALRGTKVDGHGYINQVVEAGASAVVCEELPTRMDAAVAYVQVPSSAEALARIAANFYENPSERLTLVGITGTNGKTTTVTLLYQLFARLGYNCGMLSTVRNLIKNQEYPATHTTPDPVQLNALMAQMLAQGCTHCFMEVSSHALAQRRVYALDFDVAIFSNITHDHLDYHGTFDEYIRAKKRLFDELGPKATALTNLDDKRGWVMLQNTKASKKTYALKMMADYKGRVISNTLQGLEMDVDGREAWFRLIGDFNAYNLLAAYSVGVLLGEKPEDVLTQLSMSVKIRGRFEYIQSKGKITAIIDYAHTPDALENVLQTIKNFRTGIEQVITVIGCGGNRDKTKRPMMAEVACRLSDRVILTSDNPRDEEPEDILADMEKGVSVSNYKKMLKIVDRREAIKTACALTQKNDILLVAGKGHETYQEIKGVKHDFDDRVVVREMMQLVSS